MLVRTRKFPKLALAPIGAILSQVAFAQPTAIPSIDEEAFQDSLAVNIHANYNDGAYADLAKVLKDLRYLGITHVRTSAGGGIVPFESYVPLAKGGLKFTLIIGGGAIAQGVNFSERLNKSVPGSVAAIEGFNEVNNWPVSHEGLKGEDGARAGQRALYSAAKSRSVLQNVPVFYFTGGKPVADLSGMADFCNVHAYNNNGTPPGSWIPLALKQFEGAAADMPCVNTEFGNFSLPEAWPAGKPFWSGPTALGVDETAQAKVVLGGYLEGAAHGIKRSYVYELLDQKPDPDGRNAEFHFGLFRHNHTPKPAAKAVRNMIQFLAADKTGKGNTPEVRLESPSDKIRSLAIRRSDGSVVVALWNRAYFWTWSQTSSRPVVNSPVTVRLNVTSAGRLPRIATAALHDPLKEQSSTLTPKAGGTFEVLVPDYPVLVRFNPVNEGPGLPLPFRPNHPGAKK